ncbi:helix-turn-helix transcriptional regulator [Capillimicrobium parvum]|uniref:HTH luxR-type domain-containing protein n=1 Tax=Capillimicrobium parvum TaxID=2884022 RepID=A0A9E6Y198_9ACTN|nr:LuxR family transcriptional regulator [Capillimicrobium parvum]UGS37808.1 hypothetical protein DSM104329_04229 [Capillimicrobium parvum]
MSVRADQVGSLLDREGEIEQIAQLLAAGSGGGYAYVEGHAGIGKTRLLRAARSHAATQGLRVLSARGDELESAFSYGVARQLYESALTAAGAEDRRALLDGPAAHAAPAVGLTGLPHEPISPDSAFPVVHGLYWLTVNLAARDPLMLLIDDAHWADAPSLRFIDYLVGRLEDTPVTVVLAARPTERGAPARLLDRLRDHHRPQLLRPRPLSETATCALLEERFDAVPDAAFAAACHRASAGNPFLLHELADALLADRIEPTEPAAALVADLGPDTVAHSLFLRLTRLPPEAGEVVDALAVFGNAAEVRHIGAVTGLSPEAVSELADQLADANVLTAERPLRFVHPIVREAIYNEQRPAGRARLHALAAESLLADGHPAALVAPHVLMTEAAANPATVAVLREAAAAAMGQGAPDEARDYLRRALREPPADGARAGVLAELGTAEMLGDAGLAEAGAHIEAAIELTADPELRAQRAHIAARARLFRGDLPGAVRLLDEVRSTVGPDAALSLTAHQAALGLLAPPCADDAIARLEAFTGVAGDTPAQLMALAELAGSRWLDGRIGEAAGFAERAIAGGRLLAAEGPSSTALNHALRVLIDADRYDLALPALEPAIAAARAQGSVLSLSNLLCLRAVAACRRGDVLAAEDECRNMLEAVDHADLPIVLPAHYAYLALVLVERGDLGSAEAAIMTSGCGPDLPAMTYMGIVWLARARLRLAQDRPGEAWADLAELRRRDEQTGVRHLSIQWHDTAARAALALGDADGALDVADEQLERAQRWNTPSALGVALATKGLAAGGAPGAALVEEGIALLARSPARLDHARAHVDHGIMLARAGRRTAAREALQAGLDGARRCGAAALVHSAHDELTVMGARPRKLHFSGAEALTASERRVAQMAAAGRSNREIAAALFVTVRTVENHLAHAYRKLGIGSRRELPSALG